MLRLGLAVVCLTVLVCCHSISSLVPRPIAGKMPAPQLPHPLGRVLPAPQLIALDCEEATIQVGELVRYAETFVSSVEGAPAKMYICPKDCEHGHIYPGPPGKTCPVCKYRLYEIRNGKIEHSDHHPKHQGVFFMGQDGWHHVEGVMASATEFRLYVYDNFTEPLHENCFATAEFASKSAAKPEKIDLKLSSDGSHLSGSVPPGFALPLELAVQVRFGCQDQSMLFNFRFEDITPAR